MLSLDGFTGPAEQALHSASPGLLPARTPQEPERHPGVRPNSASGPLRPEAPLRRQQALCTKTRRISKLVLGATSCSPRKGCWLLAGRTLLDKHEAQDAATPNWPKPEPVSRHELSQGGGRLKALGKVGCEHTRGADTHGGWEHPAHSRCSVNICWMRSSVLCFAGMLGGHSMT